MPCKLEISAVDSTVELDGNLAQRAVEWTSQRTRRAIASVSVVIVGDDYIHDLNRQYLGHDCTTDVITFPLSEEGRPIEGEVYINAELAARVADDHGWHAENELLLYLVHGLLHLTGFDDHTPSERAEMFQEQQRCLCEAGLPEALVRRAVPESDPTS